MLFEIHVLQNHAPSNLNRDDTGSPKECVFGGYTRARISSQCLKRTVRRSDAFGQALGAGGLATRTRQLPEQVRKTFEADPLLKPFAEAAAQKASGFGNKDGREEGKDEKSGKFLTAQSMFLTRADIEAVVTVLKQASEGVKGVKEFADLKAAALQKEATQKGFRPITVDVALFGRMTTSEAFRDVEAACQVAHALSTHKVDHEFDYFTAVDDLQGVNEAEGEEDSGADMIGDVEFNSACYYKYFSVDAEGLVDNLTGKRTFHQDQSDRGEAQAVAGRAVAALLRAAVMTTPTGKQNSFAAHQLPSLVLVEARPYPTPVSYANAFVDPARPGKGESLVRASLHQMRDHVQALTDGFNLEASARMQLIPEHKDLALPGVDLVRDLNTLCARVQALAGGGPEVTHA